SETVDMPAPASTTALVYAPLISWVSAGQLIQPDHVEELASARQVAVPDLDLSGHWIALRVVGDSMDRISPPDSVIVVNLADRRLVPNGCYIFADGEGGATFKRWRPADARHRYPQVAPVSTNKVHKPVYLKDGQEPVVIGRVRRSILEM
ncbi:S24 family peptidase, partial [Nostoc linckia]